ncbi:MAG: bifunctional pyr operon transcriptional regulator/uracil phosphoribosyltransferase PyrR [Erysipelotrichaceae bacterium]
MKTIMDENSITRTLVRMTHEIIEKNKGVENLVLVGIKTRGETIAHRIAQNIKRFEGVDIETVGFDIRYWRDDIDKTGITKPNYDLDLNHKIVVLIDDVLYKGRTVRAAMDGVMSFGRPQSIQLAVLVDRGHRELPIRADVVGKNVPTSTEESVKVSLQEVDGSDEVIILERND